MRTTEGKRMVTDRGATQVEVAGDEEGAGVARLELQLPHTTQSVRRARRTIAAFLEPSEVPGAVVEDVLLLVSELVTNAVVHAGSPAVVRLDADPERIKVAVADREPDKRPSMSDPEPTASSGRGCCWSTGWPPAGASNPSAAARSCGSSSPEGPDAAQRKIRTSTTRPVRR